MRRDVFVLVAVACATLAGCSKLERLTFIRPSAERGEYVKVAPTYDVSGRKAGKPTADIGSLVQAASDRLRRGQLDEAEHLAQQAYKINPRSADANTLLGTVADARGNTAKAGPYYQAAAALAPQSGIYANNYGGWLCENGQAAESLPWFDRALADATYPTPAFALANAGSCARKAGLDARAESQWRRALELAPENILALSGMARMQYERGRYMDARAFAQRLLAAAPEDRLGLQLAADIEQKLGDNVAASRYLARLQAIPSGPTSAPRTQ